MKLSVHVLGRDVAVLEPAGDFKSVLTYHAGSATDDFVSLTMPIRTESYTWDDQLPPVFQMNLPEGYLLQVLQEQFGPHIGASPTALLSVVGRNMVGRLQVSAPGAKLDEPPQPIEVSTLLQGDNSEAAFAELVRQHATSGVSGIVPKFLDAQKEPVAIGQHQKASLLTRRHIVKGSSSALPFIALNEYLCMQVAAKVTPTARVQVSQDGQALVVDRFDVDDQGQPHWGMEDFCALLGLRPAAKYDTTWERIGKAVRDHVPGPQRLQTNRQLATTLLLTYALRNADCHAKNLALLYTSRADVHLSPVYDMLTTVVYAGYQHNPPAISFMGKKTWEPGKALQKFITQIFGISVKVQTEIIEAISDAVSETAVQVREAMKTHPDFDDIGKRMLLAWREGVSGLRDRRMYALGDWHPTEALTGFLDPPKLVTTKAVIGRSELMRKGK
ncbi:type II toxin-antitoxin system HipA family toxin [Nevskia ramosa]|uniref:type II toxin-antitoxin system HipA family toxin n=1 Tax=Nevskia ramosa TaxID=64002 RepID=UPI003D12C2CB